MAMQAEVDADGMGMGAADRRKPNWTERLTAPIRFGFKVGVAVGVSAEGR